MIDVFGGGLEDSIDVLGGSLDTRDVFGGGLEDILGFSSLFTLFGCLLFLVFVSL